MPKEIQPPEDVAKLYYATTLPPDLFLFLSGEEVYHLATNVL
jgi:hypothetical protein